MQMPDGQGGVQLGLVGAATPDFMMDEHWNSQQNWDTRFSESRFDDQLFMADAGASNQVAAAYETRLYDNPSFASDSHAIQAKPGTGLPDEPSAFLISVLDDSAAYESGINEDGSSISDRTINIADFNVGSNLSAPDSERAVVDLEVFNFKEVPLVPFQLFSNLLSDRDGLVEASTLFEVAPTLRQGEDQQNQNVLQNGPTVSLER